MLQTVMAKAKLTLNQLESLVWLDQCLTQAPTGIAPAGTLPGSAEVKTAQSPVIDFSTRFDAFSLDSKSSYSMRWAQDLAGMIRPEDSRSNPNSKISIRIPVSPQISKTVARI